MPGRPESSQVRSCLAWSESCWTKMSWKRPAAPQHESGVGAVALWPGDGFQSPAAGSFSRDVPKLSGFAAGPAGSGYPCGFEVSAAMPWFPPPLLPPPVSLAPMQAVERESPVRHGLPESHDPETGQQSPEAPQCAPEADRISPDGGSVFRLIRTPDAVRSAAAAAGYTTYSPGC